MDKQPEVLVVVSGDGAKGTQAGAEMPGPSAPRRKNECLTVDDLYHTPDGVLFDVTVAVERLFEDVWFPPPEVESVELTAPKQLNPVGVKKDVAGTPKPELGLKKEDPKSSALEAKDLTAHKLKLEETRGSVVKKEPKLKAEETTKPRSTEVRRTRSMTLMLKEANRALGKEEDQDNDAGGYSLRWRKKSMFKHEDEDWEPEPGYRKKSFKKSLVEPGPSDNSHFGVRTRGQKAGTGDDSANFEKCQRENRPLLQRAAKQVAGRKSEWK